MSTKEEKRKAVEKFSSGKKLTKRESAILGHLHHKVFGPTLKTMKKRAKRMDDKRAEKVRRAIRHLEHDIKEQQHGIKRDRQTIKELKKVI